MTIKFNGDLRALEERLERCGVRGVWRHIAANGLHHFKAETGENLNWWPTTGTVTFQRRDVRVSRDRYARRFLPKEVRSAIGDQGKSASHRG